MRCAMTDREYPEFSDGVWDDGEWISWDWLNQQIYEQELKAEYPEAVDPALTDIFKQFIETASDYKAITGKYLQLWGEMGEIYAEIKFGLRRHRTHAQGSDGRIGNDHVEVKTISPEKSEDKVQVKRSGNFSKLLIVKISENFEFESRIFDRSVLGKSKSKIAHLSLH